METKFNVKKTMRCRPWAVCLLLSPILHLSLCAVSESHIDNMLMEYHLLSQQEVCRRLDEDSPANYQASEIYSQILSANEPFGEIPFPFILRSYITHYLLIINVYLNKCGGLLGIETPKLTEHQIVQRMIRDIRHLFNAFPNDDFSDADILRHVKLEIVPEVFDAFKGFVKKYGILDYSKHLYTYLYVYVLSVALLCRSMNVDILENLKLSISYEIITMMQYAKECLFTTVVLRDTFQRHRHLPSKILACFNTSSDGFYKVYLHGSIFSKKVLSSYQGFCENRGSDASSLLLFRNFLRIPFRGMLLSYFISSAGLLTTILITKTLIEYYLDNFYLLLAFGKIQYTIAVDRVQTFLSALSTRRILQCLLFHTQHASFGHADENYLHGFLEKVVAVHRLEIDDYVKDIKRELKEAVVREILRDYNVPENIFIRLVNEKDWDFFKSLTESLIAIRSSVLAEALDSSTFDIPGFIEVSWDNSNAFAENHFKSFLYILKFIASVKNIDFSFIDFLNFAKRGLSRKICDLSFESFSYEYLVFHTILPLIFPTDPRKVSTTQHLSLRCASRLPHFSSFPDRIIEPDLAALIILNSKTAAVALRAVSFPAFLRVLNAFSGYLSSLGNPINLNAEFLYCRLYTTGLFWAEHVVQIFSSYLLELMKQTKYFSVSLQSISDFVQCSTFKSITQDFIKNDARVHSLINQVRCNLVESLVVGFGALMQDSSWLSKEFIDEKGVTRSIIQSQVHSQFQLMSLILSKSSQTVFWSPAFTNIVQSFGICIKESVTRLKANVDICLSLQNHLWSPFRGTSYEHSKVLTLDELKNNFCICIPGEKRAPIEPYVNQASLVFLSLFYYIILVEYLMENLPTLAIDFPMDIAMANYREQVDSLKVVITMFKVFKDSEALYSGSPDFDHFISDNDAIVALMPIAFKSSLNDFSLYARDLCSSAGKLKLAKTFAQRNVPKCYCDEIDAKDVKASLASFLEATELDTVIERLKTLLETLKSYKERTLQHDQWPSFASYVYDVSESVHEGRHVEEVLSVWLRRFQSLQEFIDDIESPFTRINWADVISNSSVFSVIETLPPLDLTLFGPDPAHAWFSIGKQKFSRSILTKLGVAKANKGSNDGQVDEELAKLMVVNQKSILSTLRNNMQELEAQLGKIRASEVQTDARTERCERRIMAIKEEISFLQRKITNLHVLLGLFHEFLRVLLRLNM